MLVLSRKKDQVVCIGDDIEVKVIEIRNGTVRLGITAPKQVEVDRLEIRERKEAEMGGES